MYILWDTNGNTKNEFNIRNIKFQLSVSFIFMSRMSPKFIADDKTDSEIKVWSQNWVFQLKILKLHAIFLYRCPLCLRFSLTIKTARNSLWMVLWWHSTTNKWWGRWDDHFFGTLHNIENKRIFLKQFEKKKEMRFYSILTDYQIK